MRIGVTERGDAALDQSWRQALEEGLVDGAVVITKAPSLIGDIPDNVIVHCTITGMGGTAIEPNVYSPWSEYSAYKELRRKYGGKRIVLRVDPIIPWVALYPAGWWKEVRSVVDAGHRVRISFIDLYSHTKEGLINAGITIPAGYEFHIPLVTRKAVWEKLHKPEVCGEPDLPCTGCVSPRDVIEMGLKGYELSGKLSTQRKTCHCIAEKVELLKNRGKCYHGCVYCYWK